MELETSLKRGKRRAMLLLCPLMSFHITYSYQQCSSFSLLRVISANWMCHSSFPPWRWASRFFVEQLHPRTSTFIRIIFVHFPLTCVRMDPILFPLETMHYIRLSLRFIFSQRMIVVRISLSLLSLSQCWNKTIFHSFFCCRLLFFASFFLLLFFLLSIPRELSPPGLFTIVVFLTHSRTFILQPVRSIQKRRTDDSYPPPICFSFHFISLIATLTKSPYCYPHEQRPTTSLNELYKVPAPFAWGKWKGCNASLCFMSLPACPAVLSVRPFASLSLSIGQE